MTSPEDRPDPELYTLLGVFVIGSGMLLSASAYSGGYSPLNHFISELGNMQKTPAAILHSLGLIAGSVCLMVPARKLSSISPAGALLLRLALGGVIMTAIVPENLVLVVHLIFAVMSFVMLGVGIALVGWSVLKDESLPLRWPLIGSSVLVGVVAFLFLTAPKDRLMRIVRGEDSGPRPDIWPLAMMEWAFVISILVWVIALGAMLRELHAADTDDHHPGDWS